MVGGWVCAQITWFGTVQDGHLGAVSKSSVDGLYNGAVTDLSVGQDVGA